MKRTILRANLIRRRSNSKVVSAPIKNRVTIAEWILEWYQNYKAAKHASTTKQVQMVYINHHIIPQIGHFYLDEVETLDIQKFLNHLSVSGNRTKLKHSTKAGKPLAAWTIKKIRSLLIAAFDAAIKLGLITKNPVSETEPIPIQTLNIIPFTPEQQEIFLNGTKRHRFHTAYKLLFYTGCRRSEILGLKWDYVDLIKSQIHVREVLVNIDGKPLLKKYPKTKASIRTIPIHRDLTKLLCEHKKKQELEEKNCPNWNNKDNLVFTNKDGTPHSPVYFLHNFKNAIKRLNLPRNLRIHSTRHTFATNLLQQKTPIPDIQYLGGWSDTRVILEIYSHAVQDTHRTECERLYAPKEKKRPKKKL